MQLIGEVIKLDRGFPLVEIKDGRRFRCEHATNLVKNGTLRAVIGDKVEVSLPDGHDVGVIEKICDRTSTFVRRDPVERAIPQTLAANFDQVIIAQPVSQLNLRRLERELVLAHQCNTKVAVVLTKADLAKGRFDQSRARFDRTRYDVYPYRQVWCGEIHIDKHPVGYGFAGHRRGAAIRWQRASYDRFT